jgi:alpha(1,3/1,4) fucosyltransferase
MNTKPVEFTRVPAYGSKLNLEGVVRLPEIEGLRIAVCIRVHGGWWTKPSWDSPTAPISPDGSFSVNIATGGKDEQASEIAGFVIPADYQPPVFRGETELPAELIQRAVARAYATRSPIGTSKPLALAEDHDRGTGLLKSFVVVIPSFNNASWCRQNLESVLNQAYPLFRVIYVDDASTDGTPDLVADHLMHHAQASRVEFLRNGTRVGPLANIDQVVRSCDPNEIVVLVDGDDCLAHSHVLTRLNAIYQDPDVWVTWGQFTRVPQGGEGFCAAIPPEVVSANAFRDYPFVSSHLRTFYAGLYQRIRPTDVKDDGGQFFTIAGDVAQMFALQEMAGPHGRFVAEVLYRYNRENPLNDDKVDRAAQLRAERAIRIKARYGRVPERAGTSAPSEVCIHNGFGRRLFGTPGPLPEAEQWCRPFRQLRSVLNRLGYTVRETETLADIEGPHTLVVFDVQPEELERLASYPSDVVALILWSDPLSTPANFELKYHERFRRIYTWCDDLVDNVRYFKLHFPSLRPMVRAVRPFEERRLCTLLAPNRYSEHPGALYNEERTVAEFFTRADGDSIDFCDSERDSGGDGTMAPTSMECLQNHRFSLCYESVRGWNGLVTGKIFDSFAAGCVPVYYGAPDIASSIPGDCFIGREAFASEAELYAFLKDMPVRVHDGYLERIRAFLSSERAIPYSSEHFVRTFVELVRRRAASRKAAVVA